ncbi:MAG TPA: FAD:protein FMN transferase [Thermoanaerobaculia bacterium]|jgi:thiamine biosynthesis lipoprotein ApbE
MLPLLLALLLGAPASPPPAPPVAAPLRLTGKAFGQPVEIEVRDLSGEAARAAIQQALAEVAAVERLTGPGLAALNAAAGRGPQPVDPRLLLALLRALNFCQWSGGTHGPLGRDLYAAWGLHAVAGASEAPSSELVEQAASRAGCDRLTLDPQRGTAALAEGGGLELVGFAEGAAVDRAVETLRQRKAGNGFVRVGPVHRGFGPGPAGKGWPVTLPQVPGLEAPAGEVYLRDRSLAIAAMTDHPLQGTSSSYLNQRTGKPAQGVVAAAASTELAVDAQGLATTMLISGSRAGQMRLGSLSPRPSVLWFVGSGAGEPLLVDYRWSALSREGSAK